MKRDRSPAFQARVLTQDESSRIISRLKAVDSEFKNASYAFADSDEDIHTAVELRLGELIGSLAGKPWEYLFYIDFIGAIGDETVVRALDHLGEYALMLRVLESYPRFEY